LNYWSQHWYLVIADCWSCVRHQQRHSRPVVTCLGKQYRRFVLW